MLGASDVRRARMQLAMPGECGDDEDGDDAGVHSCVWLFRGTFTFQYPYFAGRKSAFVVN